MNNIPQVDAPKRAVRLANTPTDIVVRVEDLNLDFPFASPLTARTFATRVARATAETDGHEFMVGRPSDINPYGIPADAWETITA